MNELLDELFVTGFKPGEGHAEDGPMDGFDGGIGPFVFVLEVNPVLLCGMCITHMMVDVTGDNFVVDSEGCFSELGVVDGLEM